MNATDVLPHSKRSAPPDHAQPSRLEHLRSLFVGVTYRPGWRFEVYEDAYEGPHLRIRTDVEDAFHPGTMVELRIESPLPPNLRTADDVDEWVLWRLERIASHEVREWLRRDGVQVSNPHEEGART